MNNNKPQTKKFEVQLTETLFYNKVIEACTVGEAIDIALGCVAFDDAESSQFGTEFSVKEV